MNDQYQVDDDFWHLDSMFSYPIPPRFTYSPRVFILRDSAVYFSNLSFENYMLGVFPFIQGDIKPLFYLGFIGHI